MIFVQKTFQLLIEWGWPMGDFVSSEEKQ